MFKPKAPVIRQETVQNKVPEKKNAIPRRPASLTSPAQRIAQDRAQPRAKSPLVKGHQNSTRKAHSLKPPEESRRSSSTASAKRKRTGTPQTPGWAEDGDEEEDADLDFGIKRRQIKHDSLEPDLRRDIWSIGSKVKETGEKERDVSKQSVVGDGLANLIHAADFTSGKTVATTGITAEIYKSHFDLQEGEDIPVVELLYPSGLTERFQLVYPHSSSDEYRPMVDLHEAVQAIITHYLPEHKSDGLLDDDTSFPSRMKRAMNARNLADYRTVITEFNDLVKSSTTEIRNRVEQQHTVPIALVERILEQQSYERTVAPHSLKLKVRKEELKNEKSKTYGEIKPRFAHDIFRETKLHSDQVFVDLGSGVGNVVLQAAIETGAEAHGIEIVDFPAQCAVAQQKEVEARCRLWGIRPGAVTLHHGDLLTSPAIDAVLKRADVVFVNNRVFEPWLNDALVLKFLDLKEGCKVVSLESFVPEKWEIKINNMQDVRNMLRTKQMWYGADRVSWVHEGGHWYVATKDSSVVTRFAAKHSR